MKASYVNVADPENAVSFSLNFSVRPCTSITDQKCISEVAIRYKCLLMCVSEFVQFGGAITLTVRQHLQR
jgi:hypothetical protein